MSQILKSNTANTGVPPTIVGEWSLETGKLQDDDVKLHTDRQVARQIPQWEDHVAGILKLNGHGTGCYSKRNLRPTRRMMSGRPLSDGITGPVSGPSAVPLTTRENGMGYRHLVVSAGSERWIHSLGRQQRLKSSVSYTRQRVHRFEFQLYGTPESGYRVGGDGCTFECLVLLAGSGSGCECVHQGLVAEPIALHSPQVIRCILLL